ncbi:LD-carboxypeptidase [Piscinibacter sp.]|jgi:muramoyltetrapeptide carboxypeptidase|uniref:LD-carboxypeptidase n=1 Tax=Piscinibacter sp. TaxID=1903157 RepID=UPI001D6906B7|nr:LD-carboxypeptidase [Piscinibacter sp.]MBK7529813.1 LD-carboxypeptidase [Piscinibacter sp.]
MSTLTLFTPSGVVAAAKPLRLAQRRLAKLGFEVELDDAALARHQRFGGDDDTRLAALHRVAKQSPSIAMATRGGYGLTRLLDRIDWKMLSASIERGTRWVGHSDFTALQLGLLAHARGTTWAGPMACFDFGREAGEHGEKTLDAVDEVTRDCFVEAMSGELEAVGFRTEPGFDGLDVKGMLWGGNLCMVASLLGTPHWPRIKGGVLFLEDVNEHPYRIERSLLQLQQAGVLDAQRAIVLGAFTDFRPSPLDRGYSLKTMVAQLRSVTRTPILTGLPFGHVPTKVTLPVGARVQLVVQARDVLIGW